MGHATLSSLGADYAIDVVAFDISRLHRARPLQNVATSNAISDDKPQLLGSQSMASI